VCLALASLYLILLSTSSFGGIRLTITPQGQADSICESISVPYELVNEIIENESGWRFIANLNGGSDFGDMQVVRNTFDYWYLHLDLKGGKTRLNYLIVGIHLLKYYYVQEGKSKSNLFV